MEVRAVSARPVLVVGLVSLEGWVTATAAVARAAGWTWVAVMAVQEVRAVRVVPGAMVGPAATTVRAARAVRGATAGMAPMVAVVAAGLDTLMGMTQVE